MFNKNKFVFLITFLSFFIFPPKINAVTVTINNYPLAISSEIFNVNVSITGATNATNYLRVDLYKDGTSNYFGETYNGSDWYSGSDGKSYFPVQIQNSSASAILQAQLGNPSGGDYPGVGIYKLKIRRYTSSGSQSQNDLQTPVDIQINYVSPTPSPTPSPTIAPTATPTPTPTKTPTPSPTSTPLKTKFPTPTAIQTTSGQATSEETATPESLVLSVATSEAKSKFPLLSVIFILGGLACIGGAGYLVFRKSKGYNRTHEENKENS